MFTAVILFLLCFFGAQMTAGEDSSYYATQLHETKPTEQEAFFDRALKATVEKKDGYAFFYVIKEGVLHNLKNPIERAAALFLSSERSAIAPLFKGLTVMVPDSAVEDALYKTTSTSNEVITLKTLLYARCGETELCTEASQLLAQHTSAIPLFIGTADQLLKDSALLKKLAWRNSIRRTLTTCFVHDACKSVRLPLAVELAKKYAAKEAPWRDLVWLRILAGHTLIANKKNALSDQELIQLTKDLCTFAPKLRAASKKYAETMVGDLCDAIRANKKIKNKSALYEQFIQVGWDVPLLRDLSTQTGDYYFEDKDVFAVIERNKKTISAETAYLVANTYHMRELDDTANEFYTLAVEKGHARAREFMQAYDLVVNKKMEQCKQVLAAQEKLSTVEESCVVLFNQLRLGSWDDTDSIELCKLVKEYPNHALVQALHVGKYALKYREDGDKINFSRMMLSLEQARRLDTESTHKWLRYVTPHSKELLWQEASIQCAHKMPEMKHDFNVLAYAVYLNGDKPLTERKALLEHGACKHPLCSQLYIGALLQEHGCTLIKDLPTNERFTAYRALRHALMQGQKSHVAAQEVDGVTYKWADAILKRGGDVADLGSALVLASTMQCPDFRFTAIGTCGFGCMGNLLAFEVACDSYIALAKELGLLDEITKEANKEVTEANKKTQGVLTSAAQDALFRLYFGKVYGMVINGSASLKPNFVHSILSYGVSYLKTGGEPKTVIKKYLLSLVDQMVAKKLDAEKFKKLKMALEKLQ